MIKKTIIYISTFITVIAFAYFLAFSVRGFFIIYDKFSDNNNKKKFLNNTLPKKKFPSFCFQSANALSNDTKIKLPELIPMGAIPDSIQASHKQTITYDQFGFRNIESVWKNKKHDYVTLGDSIIADTNVSDSLLFTYRFNPNKSSINLGCGGNGLLSSMFLLEQFFSAGYSSENVLFFLNLDNDLSTDSKREYNNQYFTSPFNHQKGNNIFLNPKKYKEQYLDFINKSFLINTNNFSLLNEIFNYFNIKTIKKDLNRTIKKLKGHNNSEIITIDTGESININLMPKGMYTHRTYNLFLNFLERASKLQSMYGTNITFIFVPTNHEINTYNSNKETAQEIELFLNYKYLKYSIMSTVANSNMNIIDLIYFVEQSNYKNFINGHFKKEAHPFLANYINLNLENNNAKNMSKFMFYSSFFPSKRYSKYQVNFTKKLTNEQSNDWINITNNFLKQNRLDSYLLSPVLGYFFLNQDCDSIIKLNLVSNGLSLNYSVGNLLYKICTLKNSEKLSKSLEQIENLTNSDARYYLSDITREIKKKIREVREIK